ncbi:MAG TPA: hypothetical protein VFR32_02990 [Gaiellaceae bacterium]|nr:hypothetical protein [Gaiellaceae bacterium]
MDIHPLTNHDIGRLRVEERLLRAEEARRANEARGAQQTEPREERTHLFPRLRRRLARAAITAGLVLLGGLSASGSIVQAHNTRSPWTEATAATLVAYDATVPALSAAERAVLLPELIRTARLYAALRLAAYEVGDGQAWVTFQRLLERYRRARDHLRDGLPIEAAACKGSGAAMPGKRFTHFRCAVTSGVLEIPQTEVVLGDQDLPTVIEGPPRLIGPLEAQLDVHVTGKTSIAYRQVAR